MSTEDRPAPTKPEPQQSAVKRVTELLCDGTDLDGNDLAFLLEDNALELAERCDAAERLATATATDLAATHEALTYWKAVERQNRVEMQEVRAQLAAAQAEAGRLREEITKLMRIADNYSHRVVEPRIVQMFENIEDAARATLEVKP